MSAKLHYIGRIYTYISSYLSLVIGMNIFQIIFILSHAFITSIVKKKILDVFYKVIILFNGSLQILIDILINE